MEWVVVAVVVVIALVVFVITRRRTIEAETRARQTAADPDAAPHDDPTPRE
jgi:hypothetical protein